MASRPQRGVGPPFHAPAGVLNLDLIVLIKFNGHSAEYWDTRGGRVASVISFGKAKVTGERYQGGENEKVLL